MFITLIAYDPFWPSDTLWWHRSGSTLDQVMACCLTEPSHYLNQCWIVVNGIQWQARESNFTVSAKSITSIINYTFTKLINSKLLTTHQWRFSFQNKIKNQRSCINHGLSIKINDGLWFACDSNHAWQWSVPWMETQFLAIFLFKKEKSRHQCSITVKPCADIFVPHLCIFGDLSIWMMTLCFSKI